MSSEADFFVTFYRLGSDDPNLFFIIFFPIMMRGPLFSADYVGSRYILAQTNPHHYWVHNFTYRSTDSIISNHLILEHHYNKFMLFLILNQILGEYLCVSFCVNIVHFMSWSHTCVSYVNNCFWHAQNAHRITHKNGT